MVSLLLVAGVWGIGWAFDLPRRLRLAIIAALFLGVLLAWAVLPEGHPLQLGSQNDRRTMVLALLLGGLVPLYRVGLTWLRARAPEHGPVADPGDGQLRRYMRHIMLREIGGPGQKALREARVLVVGAGGLGAPVLLYLAASGVGRITVVDDDRVELSNLQRQIIHRDQDVGELKVKSAQRAALALNPSVKIETVEARLDAELAASLFAGQDLILDGSDNFATRQLVNQAAVAASVPLLSGALGQWEGQLSLFDPARGGPCYACIFPEPPAPGQAPSCAEAGVVGPLPGVIGTMMALEAVKLICDAGTSIRGRMMIFDGLYGENRTMRIKPREACPVCGKNTQTK